MDGDSLGLPVIRYRDGHAYVAPRRQDVATDPYLSKKLSVLRFLAVASVVVYHAYRFTPGATVVAPPPAGSVSDFVRGCVSLALMRWALPFLGLVSGYLFFRRLTPSLAGFLGKLRTRARTVLVPFLIWSGLGVLFAVAITNSAYVASGGRWAGSRRRSCRVRA